MPNKPKTFYWTQWMDILVCKNSTSIFDQFYNFLILPSSENVKSPGKYPLENKLTLSILT